MLKVVKSVLESYEKNIRYSMKIDNELEKLYENLNFYKVGKEYELTNKKIIELESTRNNIASNIEIIVDSLQGMQKEERDLIVDRFFKKKSYTILALDYHYSERTIIRKINKILIKHFNGKKLVYIFNKNF